LLKKLKNIPKFLVSDDKRKKKFYTILIIITISIVLFSLSLYFKNLISLWYWRNHGAGFYWTHYNGTEVETVWYIEAYSDASYYYEPYLMSFRYDNWNPYAGGEGPLNGYAYGPMFIYGLYFFSIFVGLFNPGMEKELLVQQSVKWTHIALDSLSVVMVYLVIINLKLLSDRKKTKHAVGLMGSIFFLFMPINLIYVDSIFLNIPQMTFFTLLGFLLFNKEKYEASAFVLAIAWLSKQMPLFLVFSWFLILWKNKSIRKALLNFFIPFVLFSFILSLPWIVVTPKSYFWRVFGPGSPLTTVNLDELSRTVTLAHSFLLFGSEGFANFYAQINSYMIPFFFFYLIALIFSYFKGKEIGESETKFTVFTTWLIINTHLFISRGVYKYYNAFITPFLVLSMILLIKEATPKISQRIFDFHETFYLLKLKIVTGINTISGEKLKINVKKKKPSSRKNKSKIQPVVNVTISVILIAMFSFFLIYFNLILIARSRYLHPFLLLILFILFSAFLPFSIYKSLAEKQSYKMFADDVLSFFRYIKRKITSFFVRIQRKKIAKTE
jgi:hypothetical protein